MEAIIPSALSVVGSLLTGGLNKEQKAIGWQQTAGPAPAAKTPTLAAMPDPMAQAAAAQRKQSIFSGGALGSADTVLTGGSEKLG